MLGKLLKYEFKATARIFLLLYAALFVVAGLNALLLSLSGYVYAGFSNEVMVVIYDTITALAVFLYVMISIAVIIATIIVFIVRFYRMLGNEGYLWFTLPVTVNQHIISKLIPAFVWSVLSGLVFFVSLGVLMMPLVGTDLFQLMPIVWNEFIGLGLNPTLWLVCLVVLLVIALLQGYLMFYAAMAMGPNIVKSRLGGSVLAYLLLYIATQIVATIQMVLLVIPLNAQVSAIESAMMWGNFTGIISAVDQIVLFGTICYCVGYLILGAIFYLLTRYFMSRKLNLA